MQSMDYHKIIVKNKIPTNDVNMHQIYKFHFLTEIVNIISTRKSYKIMNKKQLLKIHIRKKDIPTCRLQIFENYRGEES